MVQPEVTFQRESLSGIWAELTPLLEAHWREIAHNQDIPLSVDRAGYDAWDEQGMVRCYTVRKEARLIGYAVYIVGPNAHYKTSLQAKQDVLFLTSAHRGGRLGLRLVAFADEQLRADGVQVVHQHVKLAHPALGRLLIHLGYEPVETIYSRRLDR